MSGLTGGVPPYSFTWSNGEITQNLSNLSSGAYYVNILDSKGCSIDWQTGWNYIEARTSRPDIKYASSTAGSCQFNPSGEIGVYLYWEGGSNPPFTTTALNLTTNTTYNHTFPVDTTRQGVVPLQETGLYQIILKGTNGCSDTTTVYFDKLAKSISTTSKVCGNNALILATGGTPPYSYDWAYYDPINS
ncbi:MAG: hypothetical protein RLZZ292_2601 [Bacteroidota bacterium]|jgi:hypothetical protein